MILGTYTQQPREKFDYDITYEDWLPGTDAIDPAKVEVMVDVPGLTAVAYASGLVVKIWVSGGTHKTTYKITVTVESDDGRIKQDEFIVKVKDY